MNKRSKRFKKRQEIREKNKTKTFITGIVDQEEVDKLLNAGVDAQKMNNLNYTTDLNYSLDADPAEVKALLSDLKNSFDKERLDQLLAQTKKDIIFSIAGPFGLGKIIAGYDKEGGNVDTVHNVRKDIYATTKERKAYENRGNYDTHEVHSDKRYIDVNREHAEQQKSSKGIRDGYSDGLINSADNRNLDHIISAKQTHDDRGRVLAGITTEDLANNKDNLTSTSESINKSKGAKSPEEFATYMEERSCARKDRIKSLKGKCDLTNKERKELQKLNTIDNADTDKIRNKGRDAKKAQDSQINKEYYLSDKFLKSSLNTGVNEGIKMGAQQAFGVLLVEFFSSSFIEIKKAFNEGLEGESLFEDIKIRLKRIGADLSGKWKNIIKGFSGGFISGFISNLITTIVNMFITTGKRLVRMIREGIFSLLKALKLMLFPPKKMSYREATHEAMKLFAAGGVVIAGVALEEVIEKIILNIPFLVPFATIATAVIVGSLTALAMALVTYLIDKLDILGVIQIEQNKYLLETLDGNIQERLKYCENIATEINTYLVPA